MVATCATELLPLFYTIFLPVGCDQYRFMISRMMSPNSLHPWKVTLSPIVLCSTT